MPNGTWTGMVGLVHRKVMGYDASDSAMALLFMEILVFDRCCLTNENTYTLTKKVYIITMNSIIINTLTKRCI